MTLLRTIGLLMPNRKLWPTRVASGIVIGMRLLPYKNQVSTSMRILDVR